MSESWDYKASHSETEQFAACERRHYYSYGPLRLQSRSLSDGLIVGSVGHIGLGTYYEGLQAGLSVDESFDRAMLKARQVFENDYANYAFAPEKLWLQVSFLLGAYVDEYAEEKVEIHEVEVLRTVQLTQEFAMPVKFDLLATFPGYGLTLVDHKFTYDFYTVDKADLSPQLPRYFAVLESMGIKVDTIMYNQIRTRNTKDNAADPSLRFERTPVSVSRAKIARTMREQIGIAERISTLRQLPEGEWEKSVVRNSLHCQMCPFQQLCDSDMNGGDDSDLIIQAYYEPKSYK